MSKEEKANVRRSEATCWAETLGFRSEQVTFLDAEETYEKRNGVRPHDQEQMDKVIAGGQPTMIFVPHISDTAQHINFYTRQMALRSAIDWFARRYSDGDHEPRLFVVEYPTNHVPVLPPSDKNLVVAFTDPMYAEIKHQANKAHVSQKSKCFDMVEKFVEAIDAVRESDDMCQIRRAGRRFSRYLSEIQVNPRNSRGEHFGITELTVEKRGNGPAVVEKRLTFPLSAQDMKLWHICVGNDEHP